jgi:PhoPQ-activated pathogenicity-related protein
MTKAAVKAMDAIQALTAENSHVPPVTNFTVAGASKRGWTTWTTAAVDPRVSAAIPIVIPILNIIPNLNHQWQAYGTWSFALEDYLAMNITTYLNTEQFVEMAAIIDPYSYLDRLTMPKLLVCATGDEFFLPDSPQFFFDKLQGPTWLRMIANGEHSLIGHQYDVAVAVTEFYRAHITGVELPVISWTIANGTGLITLDTSHGIEPSSVKLWHATNPHKRDFRLIVCGDVYNVSCLNAILWEYKTVQSSGNGIYTGQMPLPATGWTGFFLEVSYKIGGLSDLDPISFTTEVSIVPQVLPYPPCGDNCALVDSSIPKVLNNGKD